jgi:hypothetical protein
MARACYWRWELGNGTTGQRSSVMNDASEAVTSYFERDEGDTRAADRPQNSIHFQLLLQSVYRRIVDSTMALKLPHSHASLSVL